MISFPDFFLIDLVYEKLQSMNLRLFSIFCFLQISEGEGTSKLQIGVKYQMKLFWRVFCSKERIFDEQVKRRVEGCERRSKKGDTLHIHYIGSLQVQPGFHDS